MKIKGILINGKEGEIEDDTGEYIQLRDVTATSKSVDYLAGSTEAVDLGKLGHGGIDGGSNNYLGNASHADVLKSNSNLLSSNDELNGSRLSLNSNLSIDNLAATRGDFPAILPYHPLDQALLPKLKFDYNAKSNQKKICGCVPFWVPYLFVGLAFAGVVVYFAVSDAQARLKENLSQLQPAKDYGPVVILTVTTVFACLLATFFLFVEGGKAINRRILMWVTALLSAAAFIATTVVMWSNSYFNSDYCSVREDPMFQIDPNNPETFHSYIWTVSSLLALTSVVISLINVRKHCKNYNYPLQQRYIIRILFLIPVYSILTLCSLILYRHYTFWLMIRDFYEGYAVYSFYWLLRYYLGDTEGLQTETIKAHQYHEAVEEMARFSEIESTGKRLGYFKQKKKASIQEFLDTGRKKFDMPGVGEIPYLRFNPTKRSYLAKTERYVLLYVFYRLITTIAVVVMSSLNVFCEDWTTMGNLTVTTINSMGVSFAVASVYTLAVMAHPVMVSRGLETPSFEMKFWNIKGLVLLVFGQSILVGMLWPTVLSPLFPPTQNWNSVDLKQALINFLTQLELVLLAIWHQMSFPADPYNPNKPHNSRAKECICCRTRKHTAPVDMEYRGLLNQRHQNAMGSFSAFLHAMKASDFQRNSRKYIR